MGILSKLLSYVPTVWETGDIITAEKLNNMENGIENVNDNFITIEVSNISDTPDEDGIYSCDVSLSLEDILSIDNYNSKIYVINYSDSDHVNVMGVLSTSYEDGIPSVVTISSFFRESAEYEYEVSSIGITSDFAGVSFYKYDMSSLATP